MSDLVVKYHPKFFKDLEGLSKLHLEIVHKKIERIKADPKQFKHLHGGRSVYTLRVENMRLVFYFEAPNLWFLILDSRNSVYAEYVKRLYDLKTKLQ